MDPVAGRVQSGFYRADYGPDYAADSIDLEMILNPDGTYRWFAVQYNDAVYQERGRWFSSRTYLALSQRTYGYPVALGVFDAFISGADDTSSIRAVTDTSFERLELDPSGENSVWLRYTLAADAQPVPGIYAWETPDSVADINRVEHHLETSGRWGWNFFFNGKPLQEIEAPHWIKAGTFLVLAEPRRRYYNDAQEAFDAWYDTLKGGELNYRCLVRNDTLRIWDDYFFTDYKREALAHP